jgi:hypothetical protein
MEVDLLHALGHDVNGDVSELPEREHMAPRTLKPQNNKEDIEKYVELVTAKRVECGIDTFAQEIREGKTKSKDQLNEMMEKIEHCLVDAETELRPTQKPKSSKRPNISSPQLVEKAVSVRRTYHLIRMIRQMIEKDDLNLTYITRTWDRLCVQFATLPEMESTTLEWSAWTDKLEKNSIQSKTEHDNRMAERRTDKNI